ncbi:hypothetical protein CROQUDRAFT_718701 [Cronartium quercuum f. sp. fusiforme G11]|uniref:Uncharacterized protein n=1 Tax=Cronartium quercuum f. sp. fusiforme G11 TaxID=708437 RepID=A0A9P6T6D2_9BASI|nr:hypothetical protein CROQUDRAFT_718701 [Cronartium quercuum f. sp. fusiforme G11]
MKKPSHSKSLSFTLITQSYSPVNSKSLSNMLRYNGKSISSHSVKIIILILFGLLNISVASLFKGEIETDSVHALELEDDAPRGINSPRYVAKAHQLLENLVQDYSTEDQLAARSQESKPINSQRVRSDMYNTEISQQLKTDGSDNVQIQDGKKNLDNRVIDHGIGLKQRVTTLSRAGKGQKDFPVYSVFQERVNTFEEQFESKPKKEAIENTLAKIVNYKESKEGKYRKIVHQMVTQKMVRKLLEEINDQTPTELLVQLKFATITLKELEKTQSTYMSDRLASEIDNAISKLDGVTSSRKPSINSLPVFFNGE